MDSMQSIAVGVFVTLVGTAMLIWTDRLVGMSIRQYKGALHVLDGERAVRDYSAVLRWVSRGGAVAVILLGLWTLGQALR